MRREQQVHMVRHQRVGMDFALGALCQFTQVMQKELEVRLRVEARLAVVAPLDDMDGQTSYLEASASRHPDSTDATHHGMTWLQRIA